MGTTPPPPLVIEEITATPDFPVQTTNPDVPLTTPHSSLTLFSFTNPTAFLDDTQGAHSQRPVAFYLGQNIDSNQTVKIALRVTVVFQFPNQWRSVGAKFQLQARLQSRIIGADPIEEIPVLNSGPIEVGAVYQPRFTVEMYMRVPKAFKAGAVVAVLPAKVAGDFAWKLSIVGSELVNTSLISVPPTTRLELYATNNFAPSGVLSGDQSLKPQTNFGSVYPVRLLRMFIPTFRELDALPFDAASSTQQKLSRWYCQRAVQQLWNRGNLRETGKPAHDSRRGKSSYGVGCLGGTFDLTAWVEGRYMTCNAYDVCAVVHLACGLLVYDRALAPSERLVSQWVMQDARSYVNVKALYGRTEVQTAVNNPFWEAFIAREETRAMVDPAAPSRTGFQRHTWIEVGNLEDANNSTQRRVLDASCVTLGEPMLEMGKSDRKTYLQRRLDPSRPENQSSLQLADAVFYSNTKRSVLCGVTTIKGLSYPVPPTVTGMADVGKEELPPQLKAEITTILAQADSKTTHDRTKVFIDSPIDENTLLSAVNNAPGGSVKYSSKDFRRSPWRAMFTTSFTLEPIATPAPDQPMDIEPAPTPIFTIPTAPLSIPPLAIRTFNPPAENKAAEEYPVQILIESFQDYRTARDRLIHFLTTFTAGPLNDLFGRISDKQTLGDIALRTTNEVAWVRGNTYFQASVAAPTYYQSLTLVNSPGNQALITDPLQRISLALDNYIARTLPGKATAFSIDERPIPGPKQPPVVGVPCFVAFILPDPPRSVVGERVWIQNTANIIQTGLPVVNGKTGEVRYDFLPLRAGYCRIVVTVGEVGQQVVHNWTSEFTIAAAKPAPAP